jgi:hypothetical protein
MACQSARAVSPPSWFLRTCVDDVNAAYVRRQPSNPPTRRRSCSSGGLECVAATLACLDLHEPFLPTRPEDLLALPIDVRGLRLLQVLVAAEDQHQEWVHSSNLLNPSSWGTPPNARHVEGNVHSYLRGLSEAWAWLVGEGLVAQRPDQTSKEACFVTAQGRAW